MNPPSPGENTVISHEQRIYRSGTEILIIRVGQNGSIWRVIVRRHDISCWWGYGKITPTCCSYCLSCGKVSCGFPRWWDILFTDYFVSDFSFNPRFA